MRDAAAPHAAVDVDVGRPIDPRLSLAGGGLFKSGPTRARKHGRHWAAMRTPEGPVTLAIRPAPAGATVELWGDGSDWIAPRVPELLGAHDTPDDFRPEHPLLRRLVREHPGMRLGRGASLYATLLPIILQQRVTWQEAKQGWYGLVRMASEAAPGPVELYAPPAPQAVRRVNLDRLRAYTVDRKRATLLQEVAFRAKRIEALATLPHAEIGARLRTIRGIGEWTVQKLLGSALGDPDAVTPFDAGLPNTVAYALAGEERADDARMFELLEPFRGHRGRVVRLIEAAGISAPRRGSVMPKRRY